MISSYQKAKDYYRKLKDRIPTPIIWISIVIILIVIVGVSRIGCIYYEQFKYSDYSSDITLWGYFGDFWWNLITAVTSVLNLIAFVFITIMVAKMQNKDSRENKNNQKLLLKIQIKMATVNDLREHINSLLKDPTDVNECAKTAAVFVSFQKSSSSFFDNKEYIKKQTNEIISIIDNREKIKGKEYDYINRFIPAKDELICYLLKDIQNNLE